MATSKEIERAHVGISASIDRMFKRTTPELIEEVGKLFPGMTLLADEQNREDLLKIAIKHWIGMELDPLKVSKVKQAKVRARQTKHQQQPAGQPDEYLSQILKRSE